MLTKHNHPGYEPAALGRALVLVALLLFVTLTLLFVALNGEFSQPQIKGYPVDTSTFKEPVLQYDPVAELAAYQDQEAERLSSYGWVDKNAGIAHIPIERAIDLLFEQGLPVHESAQ